MLATAARPTAGSIWSSARRRPPPIDSTISPIALGIARVSPALYAGLNLVSAAVWAALFTVLGYVFGQTIERFSGRLHVEHKLIIAGALCLAALVAFGLARGWYARRQARSPVQPGSETPPSA